MKVSVVVIGFLIALVGGLAYYVVSKEWSWWIFPIPNPFAFLQPYALLVLVVGAVLFVAGLLWNRNGGD